MAEKTKQENQEQDKPPQAPPKMEVQEARTVPDGDHTGDITKISYEERGEEGFPYLDVFIKEDKSDVELKAGFPCNRVTPENDLGRLLRRFGADVKPGDEPDFSVLKGKVKFTTETERSGKGRFARIIRDTVRPKS